MYVTCSLCGLVVSMPNVDTGTLPTCKCMQVTLTTYSSNTTAPLSTYDWNKQLNIMRNWHVTLYGYVDGQKQPVPQVFQEAFKEGELEL